MGTIKTSTANERQARASKAKEAAERAEQLTTAPSKALLRWIAKLGAGIVAGLGLAGVVGLIGSALLWQRFNEAGLPATQSLAAVPHDQRIIEGASGLIAAVLIGALAVAVLFSLDRTGRINRWSYGALALSLAGGVIFTITTDLVAGPVALLALLGTVLAGVCIGVGKVTGNQYVPFAFAVFVSTVVFAGAVNFAIAAQQNFIQPAAVLRSPEGQGIRGFYVADNDDFIYLGVIRADYRPSAGAHPGEPEAAVPLYRIPRTGNTRLLVGKLQGYDDAVAEAEDLRKQLKETKLIAPLPHNSAPAGG